MKVQNAKLIPFFIWLVSQILIFITFAKCGGFDDEASETERDVCIFQQVYIKSWTRISPYVFGMYAALCYLEDTKQ